MGGLGMHWMRVHPDDDVDMAHVRAMNFLYIQLFEYSFFNKMFCEALLRNVNDDTQFILRHHPRSEQKNDAYIQPEQTADRHAAEWEKDLQSIFLPHERCWLLGVNEPDSNVHQRAINTYTERLMRRFTENGRQGLAFDFGVGHPSTVQLRPDRPPDWSWYESSHAAIVEGGHMISCHEYGLPDNFNWGNWFGRFQEHCPWQDVKVVYREGLIDSGVAGQYPSVGYIKYGMDDNAYCDYKQTVMDYRRKDPRYETELDFTYDFAIPWGTFDVRPIRNEFERRWAGLRWETGVTPPTPPTTPPTDYTVYVPPVVMDGPQVVAGDPHYGDDEPQEPISQGILNPQVIEAILQVESGGQGFFDDGRLKIRPELHVFKKYIGAIEFEQFFNIAPVEPWKHPQYYRVSYHEPFRDAHATPDARYAALGIMTSLSAFGAYRALGMGAGQVMGENAKSIGYPSAKAMYDSFHDPNMQILAVFNYILKDRELYDAVMCKDWRTIAAKYNGTGNVDVYAPLLEGAYNEITGE